jgi:copper chaperone
MSETKIKIEGMSCNHCKMAVEKTLSNIEGIDSFSVDLEKGEALLTGNPDLKIVIDEINKLGYRATIAE